MPLASSAMSNSALLLHDLISGWTVPQGRTPESVRGGDGNAGSVEFWRQQARAARLLNDLERELNGMAAVGEEVDLYDDLILSLYQVVFSYSVAWQSSTNQGRAVTDPKDMKLLRSLGRTLNLINKALPISGEDLTDLLTYLDDVEQLVRGSQDIDDAVRRYLLGLIAEAQRVAKEYETFGDVELRTTTLELGAALLSTADSQVPRERRGGWIDGAKKLVKKGGVALTMKALDKGGDAAVDGSMDAIGTAFGALGG